MARLTTPIRVRSMIRFGRFYVAATVSTSDQEKNDLSSTLLEV